MDPRNTFYSCDRAREAASCVLDSELSPFETRLLEAHLELCPACAAFQASVAATALELRAAPLVRLERPITLPRRRALRPLQGSAAAAMAAAAVLVLTVTAPVDFERASPTRLAAPAADVESRFVPDGEMLPGDYAPTVEPTGDPIPK